MLAICSLRLVRYVLTSSLNASNLNSKFSSCLIGAWVQGEARESLTALRTSKLRRDSTACRGGSRTRTDGGGGSVSDEGADGRGWKKCCGEEAGEFVLVTEVDSYRLLVLCLCCSNNQHLVSRISRLSLRSLASESFSVSLSFRASLCIFRFSISKSLGFKAIVGAKVFLVLDLAGALTLADTVVTGTAGSSDGVGVGGLVLLGGWGEEDDGCCSSVVVQVRGAMGKGSGGEKD